MMRQYKRTILITGATDGLGRQLAHELAANAEENFVIVHGRSTKKCEETVDWLVAENRLRGQERPENVDFVAADFAKLSEALRMAEEVRLRYSRLNTLICCASILAPRKMKSHDGFEMTIQVNHLAHVVLWRELLPLLEQNSPSRMLTVGSMLHHFSSIDWSDLMCERGTYDKYTQYSRSKLMNHLATLYIHRLFFKHKKQFQVTINLVDAEQRMERKIVEREPCSPRGRSSSFAAHLSASESLLYDAQYEHTNAIETLAGLVEKREFEGISGKYYDANGHELKLGADVCDVRVQDQLWAESTLLCDSVLGTTPHRQNNSHVADGQQNSLRFPR